MGLKRWIIRKGIEGKFPKWVYDFIGKQIAKRLDLREGGMDEKKSWYKSKSVINGIVGILIGLYLTIDTQIGPQVGFDLPNIPDFVYAILGAMGIYSRVVAKTELTK